MTTFDPDEPRLDLCNHQAHEERHGKFITYRCDICGEAIWTCPARQPIDWHFVILSFAPFGTVFGLIAWLLFVLFAPN